MFPHGLEYAHLTLSLNWSPTENRVSSVTQVIPLEMLQAGERGCIADLDGRDEFVHRLEEMGLRPGVMIEMVRPGMPCILGVNHHRLSFRPEDSTTILVEVIR